MKEEREENPMLHDSVNTVLAFTFQSVPNGGNRILTVAMIYLHSPLLCYGNRATGGLCLECLQVLGTLLKC